RPSGQGRAPASFSRLVQACAGTVSTPRIHPERSRKRWRVREETMKSPIRCLGLAAVAAFILASTPVVAQKSGGVLKIEHMDNPPSASIHEEATFSVVMPFM